MNILYISHLSGSLFGGPNYSVPAQIKSQKKYDNVFWWNLSEPVLDQWCETGVFHSINEYSVKKIDGLPVPFNKPDLVIFEDFYYYDDCILGRECKKRNIPYIIIPRGALTEKAQNLKKIKKIVANFLFFKKYTRNALSVEYLTESEFKNSGLKWNCSHIIIPNGVEKKQYIIRQREDWLKGVYIGRMTSAKGVDLLIESVLNCKNLFREKKIKIDIYAPKIYELWDEYAERINTLNISDILSIHDGVVKEEKDGVLRNSDFFVMTSRFEGMPMGLIEALSYSLPCLVTEGTNFRSEIERSYSGWGCETNVESITLALKEVCNSRDCLDRLSKNAYELSLNYEWDKLAKYAHNKYKELIEEHSCNS